MRIVLAVLLTALLTWHASAQGTRKRSQQSTAAPQSDVQKKKKRAAEKAYKDSLEQLPDRKFDPWGKIR